MAVTFVIGRAGSGKSSRCLSAIAAALRADPLGPPVYWVVPKQATFQAERQLTCAPGLQGFFRARVVSFESLGDQILAERGGGAVPLVTPVGRQLILGHLLRKFSGQLQFFADVAGQSGLAARLDATYAELERNGKDVSHLRALLNDLDEAADARAVLAEEPGAIPPPAPPDLSLRNKLHDLHLIYEAYAAFLGQDRLDQHLRLTQVVSRIETSPLLQSATVYVDGFTQFSEYERRVLARLGKTCRRVEIMLPIGPRSPILGDPNLNPDDLSLFHPVEMTYKRLRQVFQQEGVAVDGPPTVLPQAYRFKSPALALIEQELFKDALPTAAGAAGVELAEAPTRRAEVDAAARAVRGYVAEGLRFRDIAVLVRDLEPYHDLIAASFAEHGIPFFADRRRQTAHHPLPQFVRCVMALATQFWPHDWMMDLLKSGLADVTPDDADALENYVLAHRVRGAAWAAREPWGFGRRSPRRANASADDSDLPPRRELEADRADALRRSVVDRLGPFIDLVRSGEKSAVRRLVAGLFELFERFHVRRTIGQWIEAREAAGDWERAAEHEQVWAGIIHLLDQVYELLGDEAVTPADFNEILELGLSQFDLAIIPPTVDQVLVGSVDRTRTPPDLRAVMVLGMSEGQFPRAPREDSVLSDAERRELSERQLEIDPGAERRLLDEDFLGYLAVTRAGERLYLSRSLSDDAGKPLGESPYWRRLRQMFPDLRPAVVRPEADSADSIGTPRQLVTSVTRWVREGGRSEGVPPLISGEQGRDALDISADPRPALYQWLSTRGPADDAIAELMSRAWPALRYDNAAALDPDVARQLFAPPLQAGVSRLETFAACPFRHFLRYGLDLRSRDSQHVSGLDLSQVYHGVLERFVGDMLSRRQNWADLEDPERRDLIRGHALQIGQELRGEILLSSARNRYILQRVARTLEQVVDNQKAVGEGGRFRPAATGFSYGGGLSPPLVLTTPKENELHLRGRMDRVDVTANGAAALVIDYKLGGDSLALDLVYHGLRLQLLAHLLVLQANGMAAGRDENAAEADRPFAPAGAFYVRLMRRLGEVSHPSQAMSPEHPQFHLNVKPRGLFDARFLKDLDAGMTTGRSQVVNAMLKTDGEVGSKGSSDLADPAEFAALLAHVRRRLGEWADGILAGTVDVKPYLIRQTSPCPTCEFHSVCRFEPAVNGYRLLDPMKREDVLRRVVDDEEGEPRRRDGAKEDAKGEDR